MDGRRHGTETASLPRLKLVPAPPVPWDDLTTREREVLSLMASGLSNLAIRERLFVESKTVESHVRQVYAKLGLDAGSDVHRRVAAVLIHLQATGGATATASVPTAAAV